MASEVTGKTTELLNTVLDKAKDLNGETRQNITAVLSIIEASLAKIDQRVGSLVEKIASTSKPPPPVDPVATFQRIAQGITTAEQLLNKEGGMMISGGKVEVLITVQIPGTNHGATSRVEFQITPKPVS